MLRWRLLGINFCIQPSFWIMNALWGYVLAGPISGGQRELTGSELLTFILVWVLCTLVSVMVHELGHVITGRIFGQAGNITITGLGGQAVGEYGELRPWQRILVIAAGPGAGFAFVAFLTVVDSTYWDRIMGFMDWENLKLRMFLIDHINPLWRINRPELYETVLLLLVMINLFVNILNLFPIIPMDGGMIFKEVCCLIAPKSGLKFAFLVSILLAGIIAIYHLLVVLSGDGMFWRRAIITLPFRLYSPGFPEFMCIIFGMMAYQCLQSYRQLASMERHELYKEQD